MSHTMHDKRKLLKRIRRIRGQVEGTEGALEQERNCSVILHTVAASRGALNSLMSEIIEGHIREHGLASHGLASGKRVEAAEELIDVVKAYPRQRERVP